MSARRILVINGPNLNMLGQREPSVYGTQTLDDINEGLKSFVEKNAKELGAAELQFVQSNIEGELVTIIQTTKKNNFHGVVINPGAFGHTSIAIRDAFLSVGVPFVEVHISNTFSREEFRHKSYLSDIARGVIIGLGAQGYELAIRALLKD